MSYKKNGIRICVMIIAIATIATAFYGIAENASATDWSPPMPATKDGIPAHAIVSLGPYYDLSSAGVNPAHYYGPMAAMIRAANGNLIVFDRDGVSHIGPTDYGAAVYFISTDNGVTFDAGHLLTPGNAGLHIDVRNLAAGVTNTGRIIVSYWEYITNAPGGLGETSHGYLTYKTSDDNGVTFSLEHALRPGTIGGFNTSYSWVDESTICSPAGTIRMFGNNRVGFTFYAFNDTWGVNTSVTGFAYSDSNGALNSWHFTNITPVGYLSNNTLYDEADIAYLGSNQAVAMVRMDYSPFYRMFTTTDNGLHWSDRGSKGQLTNGQRCPVLSLIKDNQGGLWVLGQFPYDTYFYSLAYGPALMSQGTAAWVTSDQYYPGGVTTGWGMGGATVLDESTGLGLTLTNDGGPGYGVVQPSMMHLQRVTVSITVSMLPANVHPYVVIILVMYSLIMVMQVAGFMSKMKEKGVAKNDLIGLVIFLVISIVLMGILIAILGPV